MGGEYQPRDLPKRRWTEEDSETPEETADREDDEPVEFEPDPELAQRLRKRLH